MALLNSVKNPALRSPPATLPANSQFLRPKDAGCVRSDALVQFDLRHPRVGARHERPAGHRHDPVVRQSRNRTLQASYFKLAEWNVLEKKLGGDMWKINEAFLEQQIRAGKEIILSHDPSIAKFFSCRGTVS